MCRKILAYVGLLAVAILAFGIAYFLPLEEIANSIVLFPGGVALCGVVFLIIKDNLAHERRKELQQLKQKFELGTASHMANVAFDKHTEFCEKYLSQIHNTVKNLWKDGPTDKALGYSQEFSELRQEYAAWLTDEINEQLLPFEKTLWNIGVNQSFVNNSVGVEGYKEKRSVSINKASEDFERLLNFDDKTDRDQDVEIEAVKKKVKNILEIDKILELRRRVIHSAIN